MGIQQFRINSGPIAADGTATAVGRFMKGEIFSVEINYPANTCTVDLDSQEAVVQKIIDLAADNTDKVVYPRTSAQDNAGSAVAYDGVNAIKVPFTVHGRVKLSIASGTAGEIVTVFINART